MKNIGSEKDDRRKKEAESLKVRERDTDRNWQKKERERQTDIKQRFTEKQTKQSPLDSFGLILCLFRTMEYPF